MNSKNYRAYVMNKQKHEKKTLVIEVESVYETKLLLATKQFDVKNVDELVFTNTAGEVLATFDVSKIDLF